MKRRGAVVVVVVCAMAGAAAAQQPAPDRARLETGARLYALHCRTCHGPEGDAIGGVNLRTGQYKRAATDLDVMNTILRGVPGTAMPANQLSNGDLSMLVAYLHVMKDYGAKEVAIGDAAKGREIFEGKGGCSSCHRVNDKGSYLGPDLSEIGGSRAAATLEDTLLDPQGAAQPGNRSIRAVLPDGTVVTGRRLNEDTWSVQIMDSHERLVSLWKPELKDYTILPSPMPSYRNTLTATERADVVAYLLSLQPKRSAR
jgi:putative heme-binding domain-containing protein